MDEENLVFIETEDRESSGVFDNKLWRLSLLGTQLVERFLE